MGEFEVVDEFTLAVDELEADRAIAGFNQHGAVVAVVAKLAAGHRAEKTIYRTAPQAVDEIDDAILDQRYVAYGASPLDRPHPVMLLRTPDLEVLHLDGEVVEGQGGFFHKTTNKILFGQ